MKNKVKRIWPKVQQMWMMVVKVLEYAKQQNGQKCQHVRLHAVLVYQCEPVHLLIIWDGKSVHMCLLVNNTLIYTTYVFIFYMN